MDHVRDASGFDAVTTGREFVVVVLELGVEQLNLVEDLLSPLSVSSDTLDLCKVFPLVEASHSVAERVVLGRRSVDEVGEPCRERLDRLQGRVVRGRVETDDVRFFVAGPARQEFG
jgi:hypothetical protein